MPFNLQFYKIFDLNPNLKFDFRQDDEEKIDSPPIENIDLRRRFTLITPTETIPSDVDDEQPNEEEDGI